MTSPVRIPADVDMADKVIGPLTARQLAILAVTVSHKFFADYGFAVGPLLWIVCSLVSGRLLRLPLAFSLFCAAAGGVAAVLVMLVTVHELGIVAGIAVFAACASGYERPADAPPDRLGPQSSTP